MAEKRGRGRPPKVTTAVKAAIVAKAGAGLSQVQIAKDMKIGRTTINKVVNQTDVKDKIARVAAALFHDTLDDTVTLIQDTLVTSMNQGITNTNDEGVEIIDKDKLALRNTALKTGDRIQQGAGIMPSQTTNYIQNIISGENINILTPNVQSILDKQLENLIIDVEEEG